VRGGGGGPDGPRSSNSTRSASHRVLARGAAAGRDCAGRAGGALTAPDQLLRQTENAHPRSSITGSSRHRSNITSRMSELDVRRESIDLALAAATPYCRDARPAGRDAHHPEHALHQAETAFEELEQRSTQTLATFRPTLPDWARSGRSHRIGPRTSGATGPGTGWNGSPR
jgi:hypothetical protein